MTAEWAGVGFIIFPALRGRAEFLQLNSRIASIRLRIPRGRFSVTTVYAPHNLADTDAKLQFYESLQAHLRSFSVNGPQIIAGDLNARLGQRRALENNFLGDLF